MKEGHIFIDGEITPDYHLYVKEKLDVLKDASKIILHIQSPGGSVYGGYKTYHVLKGSGKPIEAIIEGECQSIATFISLAADKIIARNPSRYMIHNPSGGVEGTAKDFESGAIQLRQIEQEMAEAYSNKSKQPLERIREMMEKETSFTATTAKEMGFIDEVTDQLKAVAFGKRMETNIFNRLSEMFAKASKEVFGPVMMDLKLKDGTVLFVESEDGELVGKPAKVGGNPAPDGTHMLEDGRAIVTVGGLVTEVKEAAVAAPADQSQQIAALQAEIQALKTAQATAEQAKAEAETKVQTQATMFKELQTEFTALRKKTIGDSTPPGAAAVFKKDSEPSAEANMYAEMQAEVFKAAGLGWIDEHRKKINQN